MEKRYIHNYDDIILYSLKEKMRTDPNCPTLTFKEIRKACTEMQKKLLMKYTPDKKEFYAAIYNYLERLEMETKITIYTADGKIDFIGLTKWGKEYLEKTEITFS